MPRNLQSVQDSVHGGKPVRTWESEDEDAKAATSSLDPDPAAGPACPAKRPAKPFRLARKDLRRILDRATAAGQSPASVLQFSMQKPYERLTTAALSGYSAGVISRQGLRASQRTVTGLDTVLKRVSLAEAERENGKMYKDWNGKIANYSLPRTGDSRTGQTARPYDVYIPPQNSL